MIDSFLLLLFVATGALCHVMPPGVPEAREYVRPTETPKVGQAGDLCLSHDMCMGKLQCNMRGDRWTCFCPDGDGQCGNSLVGGPTVQEYGDYCTSKSNCLGNMICVNTKCRCPDGMAYYENGECAVPPSTTQASVEAGTSMVLASTAILSLCLTLTMAY